MDRMLQLAFLAAIFIAVVSLTLWAAQILEGVAAVNRRIRGQAVNSPIAPVRASNVVKKLGVSNPLFSWIQASTSISDTAERRKLQKTLAIAGFESTSAPVWFIIARFTLAIGLPFLFLATQAFSAEPVTGPALIFVSLFCCAVGMIAPQAIIDRLAQVKRTAIENEFPDALDLMVVCVEAGLGLEAAFVRVGSEIAESHPHISRQFQMVSDELRAGRSRGDALRALGERSDVAALRSFAALLIQTDSLGTSIAQTLRTYSQEMREHRFLKAEEKAMRIPVLMTVPLVACILPVIITALLLPSIIDVVRDIIPAMTGAR